MFNLAIDSKLRGCDVVAIKVEDVAPNGYAIDRATVRIALCRLIVQSHNTDFRRQTSLRRLVTRTGQTTEISVLAYPAVVCWGVSMKLYVTYTSPYARLARIIVLEKALEDRVEIIEAKTRTRESPYYQINPSGRVPYLVDDAGVGMEDSQLICSYLDSLDGKPRFHKPRGSPDWAYLRLEFIARSMCEGIAVWGREMSRPESERSPTVLAHEVERSQRMADIFEGYVADPLMQGAPGMAHLILAVAIEMARKRGLGDLSNGRPHLARWMLSMSDLPSMRRTAPP
jgi:glutathione S-transferase